MNKVRAAVALAIGTAALSAPALSAQAETGFADNHKVMFYYNSGDKGSVTSWGDWELGSDNGVSDLAGYKFLGSGAGKGQAVKNNAASVWNLTDCTVRVYYNSGYRGSYDSIGSGNHANLSKTYNENASFKLVNC